MSVVVAGPAACGGKYGLTFGLGERSSTVAPINKESLLPCPLSKSAPFKLENKSLPARCVALAAMILRFYLK